MALRLEYFLVAEGVAVDQATNTVSIFSVLEEISSPSFPVVLAKAVAVGLWTAQTDDDIGTDHQVILRIRLPSGQEHRFPINFTMTHRRQRVTQHIQGVPLANEGMLEFEALLDGQHAARHLVEVLPAPPGSNATAQLVVEADGHPT